MNLPRYPVMPSLSIRPGLRRFGRILSVLLGLSLGHVGLFGSAGDSLVSIDGHKASANRVIARESGDIAAASSSRVSGVSVEARSRLVSGLVVLSVDLEEAVSTSAAGAASTEPTGDRLIRRIKELRASGRYEYVEPDWVVSTFQAAPTPDDAGFEDGRLWGLLNEGQNGGTAGIDINVEPAWQITGGDPSVVVGVVDTGVRFTHNDLAENMWVNPGEIPDNGIDDDNNGFIDDVFGVDAIGRTGNPIDRNDHGSHVGGTIAATPFNNGAHVGVAFESRIMALKFLNDIGTGFTSGAILAIDYGVAQGADILNNSWGGGPFSQALLESIQAANEAEVLFIAAAGNDANDNDEMATYPANYDVPNVISVAAVDRNGELADFSNFGVRTVDLGAPGVEIFSSTARSDSSYASFQGTSMAAPHVAGVAALLKSEFPDAGIIELRNRLLNTVRPLESLAGITLTGGMADAEAALTITADGTLDLAVETPETLVEDREAVLFISVTDLLPVTGATVTGFIESLPDRVESFRDDGIAPDEEADDGIYAATLRMPDDTNSATLVVDASAPDKDPVSGETFPLSVVGPPDNDDFADREVLQPGRTVALGTNILADSESGEPLPFGGSKTVWWQWNAPEDGTVRISTRNSDFDTALSIFIGDELDELIQIASNDDADGSFQSEVVFQARAGEVYHLQVDGIGGDEGDIVLNFPAPGSTTPGGVFIRSNPQDVTARHNRSFTLSVDAGGLSPLAYQWFFFESGFIDDAEPLPGAVGSELTVEFATEEDAGSYFVEVTNDLNSETSSVAVVNVTPPDANLPENDDLADAAPIPAASEDDETAATSLETVTGSNVDATREPGEPDHAGASAPQSSVWYRWTAPDSGILRLDTIGSSFDTVLAVYTTPAGGPSGFGDLTEAASNDDFGGSTISEVELAVQEGQTYFIAVDGFAAVEGSYRLNLEFLTDGSAGSNDAFADRIALSPSAESSETFFGSNVGASHEPGEPNHAGVALPEGKSVWWSLTAPVSGPVEITTQGSVFDTVLAVYRGDSVDNLSRIVANDDADGLGRQSRVRFTADAGEVFAIAVDGFGQAEGNIRLSIEIVSDDASPAGGGILLLDAFGGFDSNARDSAAQVLRQLGHRVTVRNNEANGDYPALRDAAFLAGFDWLVMAPRESGDRLPAAVTTALQTYVQDGGHLLVTGFDSLGAAPDPALADLLGLQNPEDRPSVSSTQWVFADLDHPILDGPFADLRSQNLSGASYDFDGFSADSAAGTLVLATLGDEAATPRLTFRPLSSGGSAAYWNGGLRPSQGDAQPDFSELGFTRGLLANFAHFIMEASPEEPTPAAPSILAQPGDVSLSVGDATQLQIAVDSVRGLSYQWFKDGSELPGAESKIFAIEDAVPADAGNYFVRVRDDLGAQTTSRTVQVQVSGEEPSEETSPGATLPEALQGASALGGDWYRLSWFGAFAAPGGLESPWIFRNDLGWMYVLPGRAESGFWSWSDALSSWLWTSQSAAENGFYYKWSDTDWTFIQPKPSGFGAWIRSMTSGQWSELNP